ncbi:glucosaminidase domain-containing protein [Streptococcus dentiloxodontae]
MAKQKRKKRGRPRSKKKKWLKAAQKKQLKKWSLIGIGLLALIILLANLHLPKQEAEKNMTSADPTTVAFIAKIGDTARTLAAKNDLYASVMIAQAILESDSGQSTLSQAPAYNYFGIKGDYNGDSVTMKTWEDDGQGNAYTIDAQFRSYGSVQASLEDYVVFLQKSIYSGVHKSNTSTYEDATAALTGVYATDTSYGSKLNSIIERYKLTIYDTY